MKIYSVKDKQFGEYGKVLTGGFGSLLKILAQKECPKNGTVYVATDKDLEKCDEFYRLQSENFAGMPIQIGYCNGFNKKLNCLEYHKSSEFNIAADDCILLLGKIQEIECGKFDTSKVKAFLLPAGTGVELYATTLHYTPCSVSGNGFHVAVVLPHGTNFAKPQDTVSPLLAGVNKWLLAHIESPEASYGAYVGLTGENLTI